MPTPRQVALAHYRQQAALTKQAAKAANSVWAAVEFSDLDGSWAAIASRAEGLLAAGQYAAASQAAGYILAQVEAQGLEADTVAAVDPRGFSGTAADGRPLSSLLQQAIINTKFAIGAGMSRSDAMLRGKASLTTVYANETAQAGRDADHVGMVGQKSMTGYVRMLSGASCSRCTVLAGKWFHYNQGFLRHPHCDCIHVPSSESVGVNDIRTDPEATFRSLSHAEQDEIFTKAGAEAIRNGADMGRVVNARQSMTIPKGRRFWRGTPTTRTVEDCLRASNGDRDELVRLLHESGYFRARIVRLPEPPPALQFEALRPVHAPPLPSRITVDMTGIDKDVAAEAVSELEKLTAAFPETAAQLDYIGSSANAKRLWRVGGASHKGDTYAWTLRPQATRGSPLALATNVKGMRTLEQWRARIASETGIGWLAKGSGSVSQIVAHEFGHQLFFTATKGAARKAAWEAGVARRLGIDPADHAAFQRALAKNTPEISKYATTNADERFAEAFASVWHGEQPTKFATILVEEALRVIREVPA